MKHFIAKVKLESLTSANISRLGHLVLGSKKLPVINYLGYWAQHWQELLQTLNKLAQFYWQKILAYHAQQWK